MINSTTKSMLNGWYFKRVWLKKINISIVFCFAFVSCGLFRWWKIIIIDNIVSFIIGFNVREENEDGNHWNEYIKAACIGLTDDYRQMCSYSFQLARNNGIAHFLSFFVIWNWVERMSNTIRICHNIDKFNYCTKSPLSLFQPSIANWTEMRTDKSETIRDREEKGAKSEKK